MSELPRIESYNQIYLDTNLIGGTLSEFILYLQRLQEEYKEYDSINLNIDNSEDYYSNNNDCGCTLKAFLNISRPETDEEYQSRVNAVKEAKRQQAKTLRDRKKKKEEIEKELYLKLAAKYGSTP